MDGARRAPGLGCDTSMPMSSVGGSESSCSRSSARGLMTCATHHSSVLRRSAAHRVVEAAELDVDLEQNVGDQLRRALWVGDVRRHQALREAAELRLKYVFDLACEQVRPGVFAGGLPTVEAHAFVRQQHKDKLRIGVLLAEIAQTVLQAVGVRNSGGHAVGPRVHGEAVLLGQVDEELEEVADVRRLQHAVEVDHSPVVEARDVHHALVAQVPCALARRLALQMSGAERFNDHTSSSKPKCRTRALAARAGAPPPWSCLTRP